MRLPLSQNCPKYWVGEAVKPIVLNGLGFINQARFIYYLVLDSKDLPTNR